MADDFDDNFLEQLANSKVTDKASAYLRAGAGKAVVRSFKMITPDAGRTAVFEAVVIEATSAGKSDTIKPNTPGEVVTMMYQFEQGKADKKAAVLSSFKKDLCAIMGEDFETNSKEKFGKMLKAAIDTGLTGIPFSFVSRNSGFKTTKTQEEIHYFNLTGIPVTKEKLLDLKAKVQASAKPEEYGI